MMNATAILLSLVLTLFSFATNVQAKEVQVIEIRKNLQLTNGEPVFTDYYLNAGDDLGIKPGTTFVLYRRVNVIDRLGTNQGRALSLPVGKIKIIYVAKDLSVARVDKLEENKNTPVLEHRGVMLGDLINVGSAAMSNDGEKGASYYGPQGLDVSFAAQPITPVLKEESVKVEARMPAAVDTIKTQGAADTKALEVLSAKPSQNNVESIKSNPKSSQKTELPLIR